MTRLILVSMAALGLVACGGSPETETPSAETDQANAVAREAAPDLGMMPPPPEFTEDGAVVTASIGDEISLLFDLPEGVSTSMVWSPIGGAYPSILSHDRTWHTLEGSLRYSEIVMTAAEAGTASVTFYVFDSGEVSDWPERRVTFEISD